MQSHRNYLRLSDTVYSADRSFQHPSSNTTTMHPTTLVTFLFKAPPEARTVELLGSWDNFTHPYLMENDRRRGAGFWSGCFKFENIIFDGDSSNRNKPRTGGLKQGGTYWYYYRLNDEDEVFDDSKEHTTYCPLLPGQPMNVIEVPLELPQEVPPRARSASMDIAATIANLPSTQTLDPRDKFNPLEPPPVSKVHGRCLSDLALNGRLETKAHALRSMESIPSPPDSSAGEQDLVASSTDQASRPRFYCEGDLGRTSFNSQRSCHSSAPSYAHSSFNEDYDYHTTQFDLTPVLEVPSSRPGSSNSHGQRPDFDFGFQENSSGSWIEDVEPGLLPPGAQASANLLICTADEQATWLHQPSSSGPRQWDPYHRWSTHDLQKDGHFDDAWTLPEAVSPLEVFPLSPRPYTSHGDVRSAKLSQWPARELTDTGHFVDERPLPQEADEEDFDQSRPRGDHDAFDVLSPSFSAATISSVGLGTPFHLSGTTSAHGAKPNNDSSIHEVAERLRSLSAEDLDRRNQVYESEERALSTYTLPQLEETPAEIVQRHTKIPSPKPSIADNLTLPSIMQQTAVGSLEDDIFASLSF